jgi:hypothetical protein
MGAERHVENGSRTSSETQEVATFIFFTPALKLIVEPNSIRVLEVDDR